MDTTNKKKDFKHEEVSEAAYVFIIEFFIFFLVTFGILTMNRLPVLPGAVISGVGSAFVFIFISFLGIKFEFQYRSPKSLPLSVDPHVVLLCLLQGALHHTVAAFINFAVTTAAILTYTGDYKDQYFAVLFSASIKETPVWYLSQLGIVVLLALTLVLSGFILVLFTALRKNIDNKADIRAHFMGFINAYIFFNILISYLMQSTKVRVCQAIEVDDTCDLQIFEENQNFEWGEHIEIYVAFAVVMACDFLSEVGFDLMYIPNNARDWLGLLWLSLYLLSRLLLGGAVSTFYIFIEQSVAGIFPFWFRAMHVIVYWIALIFEITVGLSESVIANPPKITESNLDGVSMAVDMKHGMNIKGNITGPTSTKAKSRRLPTVFFGKSQLDKKDR